MVARRCSNRTSCPAQWREALLFFASRNAMNIERLGPALVDQLLEHGQVKDLADLYTLKKNELAELERMADKSAQNVIDALEQSRSQATLSDFITGLGITHVGRVAAAHLAKQFASVEGMLQAGVEKTAPQKTNPQLIIDLLLQIHGIGLVMAKSVADYLDQEANRKLLQKFIKLGINPQYRSTVANQGPLKGLSFCITGTLTRPREEFKRLIESSGGEWHDTVKRNTSYLIRGEGPPSRKDELAEKFKTRKINENEFEKLNQTN
jgi:DNA ligase (NAD+)